MKKTKIQKVEHIKNLLTELITEIDDLLNLAYRRKYTQQQKYEQKKIKLQCTAAWSCKNKIVPQHTMCSYHLRKAAQACERRNKKRKY